LGLPATGKGWIVHRPDETNINRDLVIHERFLANSVEHARYSFVSYQISSEPLASNQISAGLSWSSGYKGEAELAPRVVPIGIDQHHRLPGTESELSGKHGDGERGRDEGGEDVVAAVPG
jgi:hypothetical protein